MKNTFYKFYVTIDERTKKKKESWNHENEIDEIDETTKRQAMSFRRKTSFDNVVFFQHQTNTKNNDNKNKIKTNKKYMV